jgi:hypothetical protein
MQTKHRIVYRIAVTALIAGLGAAALASTNDERAPSGAQVASAQQVSDLMVNELVAALFQEFNETTPANADQGKQAISLIFNDHNRDMRLIGSFGPLLGGENDRPSGNFETTALSRALTGQPYTGVQKINDTWYYRRSVPLSNTFHPACVVCHANFTPEFFTNSHNPGQWVGSLVLSVPIKAAGDDQK